MHSLYLKRYAWPHPLFPDNNIDDKTGIIVVVPAYNEPHLMKALVSLQACHKPKSNVLILVIINESEREVKQIHHENLRSFEDVHAISGPYPVLSTIQTFPFKHAGVGLARKVGMDEAVRLFQRINKDGIIACYDADCTCEPNFLIEIEKFFSVQKNHTALTFFEHVLNDENDKEITNYELFLRYYVNGLRWAGYPYALQTLGSCISVRSSAYVRQGGMNRRKAAEDFYFIHKMVGIGGIGEINTTTIFPSSRISERVPFGTGHAVKKLKDQHHPSYLVYAPAIFEDLKALIDSLDKIYKLKDINSVSLPKAIKSFLEDHSFPDKLDELLNETSTFDSFIKRFYQWFDGLKVLKYVHYARDNYHDLSEISQAIEWLNRNYFSFQLHGIDHQEILLQIRKLDRKTSFHIK